MSFYKISETSRWSLDDYFVTATLFDPETNEIKYEDIETSAGLIERKDYLQPTPEIWAQYQAEVTRRNRHERAKQLMILRECAIHSYKDMNLKNHVQYLRLDKALRLTAAKTKTDSALLWIAVRQLLVVKEFRSKFREGLANQIRSWLNESEHKYETPLSYKQAVALVNQPQVKRWARFSVC